MQIMRGSDSQVCASQQEFFPAFRFVLHSRPPCGERPKEGVGEIRIFKGFSPLSINFN